LGSISKAIFKKRRKGKKKENSKFAVLKLSFLPDPIVCYHTKRTQQKYSTKNHVILTCTQLSVLNVK
jgi:hypothetical protein